MEYEISELWAAVNFAKTQCEGYKRKYFVNKYFCGIGLGNFNKKIAQPGNINAADFKTKKLFIDFYRNNAPDSNDASLYRSMLNLLSDSQLYVNYQNLLKNYVGQYYCYRLSGKSDFPIVEGNVEIFEDIALNLFRFEHKYEYFPSDGAVPINFIHRGPVFLQSDRLYLIGIGRDDDANYMRPIILKSVDDPARKALAGLLMTESVNQVPFSCKTLFISVALKNTLVNRFGDDDKFVQFVVKKLTVNALSKDIIFGWSEQTERLGETA